MKSKVIFTSSRKTNSDLDTQPETRKTRFHTMKTLPDELTHQGHTLRLIKRVGNVALFQTNREGESTPGFLVAKIRTQKGGTRTFPNGRTVTIEAGEYLPNENEMGAQGWFYRKEADAQICLAACVTAANSAPNSKKVSTQRKTLIPA